MFGIKYKTFTIQLQLQEYEFIGSLVKSGKYRTKIDAIRSLIRKEMEACKNERRNS
jgi:Arc/MetJ-type ribon-helix-helix transcriptional regulator